LAFLNDVTVTEVAPSPDCDVNSAATAPAEEVLVNPLEPVNVHDVLADPLSRSTLFVPSVIRRQDVVASVVTLRVSAAPWRAYSFPPTVAVRVASELPYDALTVDAALAATLPKPISPAEMSASAVAP
jgi:hypothetical protein